MKKMRCLKSIIIISVCLTFIFSLNIFASTKKLNYVDTNYIIRKWGGFTPVSFANKKAKTVKTGTTTVIMPSKENAFGTNGYLKFKAPKSKVYTFTVSNLKDPALNKELDDDYSYLDEYESEDYSFGYFSVCVVKKKYLDYAVLKTQGGSADGLNIATKEGMDLDENRKKSERELCSRYGKLFLKKGQTVYLDFYFPVNSSVKLRIK